MSKVGDTARVRRSGSHVDHKSPIEDQVVEVFHAAQKLAKAKKFKAHVHNGPYGAVRGVAGPMTLTQLVRQLFPGYGDDEFRTAYSIINQALRKTDTMVCIRRPVGDPQHRDPKDLPIWFIRDKMPGNLVVVTLAQAKKSAGDTPPNRFSEKEFLTPRERRLRPEEAGEDLLPGEITVTRTTTTTETIVQSNDDVDQRRRQALAAERERVKQEHERFISRVHEEIQTNPVPLTTWDLTYLLNESEGWDFHNTTYRDAVAKLRDAGKIVGRKETDDERLLRGGGSMPKGGRSTLWVAAPGPVPTRTKLPDGIRPYRSAIEWDLARREQLEADMRAIVEYIATHRRDERRRTHFINRLDLTDERLDAALERLLANDEVYVNQGRYYLSGNSRKTTAREEAKSLPSDNQVDTVQTAPSPKADTAQAKDGDEGDLQLVLSLAAKLGVQLPTGDEAKIRELETTVRGLTDQVTDLMKVNEKLREQVSALKAAIAALA